MKEKERLVIILPERLEDIPIKIIRSSSHEQIVFSIQTEETLYANNLERKYVLIWRQYDYVKVSIDEIQWIEADKSYSKIVLTGDRTLVISFNLAVVEKKLLGTDLIRIHRSYIVNMCHIESVMGNCVKIGKEMLSIGREYKDSVLERFIFLGVRRSPR